MDAILKQFVESKTEKINLNLVNGTAEMILKELPDYIDSIIRTSIKSINSNVNLKYDGYRIMTPDEIYESQLNDVYKPDKTKNTSKSKYDILTSYLYMVEFKFSCDDIKYTKNIYLPYGEEGNITMFNNTRYLVTPVLTDKVISVGGIGKPIIFVKVLKRKLNFETETFSLIQNGSMVHVTNVHVDTNKGKVNTGVNRKKPLVKLAGLYLLCKYGFQGYIDRYAPELSGKLQITTKNTAEEFGLDPDAYVFKTPSSVLNRTNDDVLIVLDGDMELTHEYKLFISTIIYIMDLNNTDATIRDLLTVLNTPDETRFWKKMFIRIQHPDIIGEDGYLLDVNKQFEELDYYLDSISKELLADIGVKTENFYDLMYVIMVNAQNWINDAIGYNDDLNNKYFDIKYYICYNMIVAINNLIKDINKRTEKNNANIHDEIANAFKNATGEYNWSPKGIFKLITSSKLNLTMSTAEAYGDLMYPKCTSLQEMQCRGKGVLKKGKNGSFPEELMKLDANTCVIGSLLFLKKSAATGKLSSNMFMKYGNISNGEIYLDEHDKKFIEAVDSLLKSGVKPGDAMVSLDEFNVLDSEIAREIEMDLDGDFEDFEDDE